MDIIIGTHRLVSKDVKFKDLGLMIIDEEQKFGVYTKEKLKANARQCGYAYAYGNTDSTYAAFFADGRKRFFHYYHPAAKPPAG